MIDKFKKLHEVAFFAGLFFDNNKELSCDAYERHCKIYFKDYEKPFRVVTEYIDSDTPYFQNYEDAKFYLDSNDVDDFEYSIECLCVNGEWVEIIKTG